MPTSQSSVYNPDGYGDKLPTLEADLGLFTAGPNVIIVSHINIKH